jgi:hypothetical protein
MSPHQLLWNPITGSDGCRAGDASDHAAAPPRSVMNSRRLSIPSWHAACMGLSLSSDINTIFVLLCHSILLFGPRREHSFVPTACFHRRLRAAAVKHTFHAILHFLHSSFFVRL